MLRQEECFDTSRRWSQSYNGRAWDLLAKIGKPRKMPGSHPNIHHTRFDHFPALLAGIFGLVAFAISLGGTYVYDDFMIFFTDDRMSDPSKWVLYWTDSYNRGVDNLYRPLVSMSFAIQWYLHGDRAWAFHLVNIALHGLVSALVAELVRRLAGFMPGLIAGVLFAVHPIHVEAVANIVGRSELMCALGMLGAMVLLMSAKPLTITRALSIVGCFIVALLSKEQGMLTPLLLAVLYLCTRASRPTTALTSDSAADGAPILDYSRGSSDPVRRAALILVFLLCATLAAYIVWRESILKFWWERSFLDHTIQPMIRSEHLDRTFMPVVLFGRYLQLLIAPLELSPDYGGEVIGFRVNFFDPYLFVGIAGAIVYLGTLVFALIFRKRTLAFLLIGFGVTYGVVGNIVTLIGTNFAERLMYLPSVFFVGIVAMVLARLPVRASIIVLILLTGASLLRTVTYAHRWNDRLNFYITSLNEQPKSMRLHMLTATELARLRRFDEAREYATLGRKLMPDYWDIWLVSARIEIEAGDLQRAREYVGEAMNLKPSTVIEGWVKRIEELERERSGEE
jgi:hypothetical protein